MHDLSLSHSTQAWLLPVMSAGLMSHTLLPFCYELNVSVTLHHNFSSQCLLISWLQSPSAVTLEPPEIKSVTVSILSPCICHEVMGLDAMILILPEFLPGESQGQRSLVGCRLWGRTESDTTEAT